MLQEARARLLCAEYGAIPCPVSQRRWVVVVLLEVRGAAVGSQPEQQYVVLRGVPAEWQAWEGRWYERDAGHTRLRMRPLRPPPRGAGGAGASVGRRSRPNWSSPQQATYEEARGRRPSGEVFVFERRVAWP